jgi:hypothetical protein
MSGLAKLIIPTALYAVSNEYTYANLSASNALTTSNILTMNATVSGSMFVAGSSTAGSLTLGVTGNIYVSNAITTTNISAATTVFTGPVRVDSNIYSSNAVTTKNVFLRGRIVLNTETGPAEGKTTVQSTDNILISNSINTTNVWTSALRTTGRVTADGQAGATTMLLSGNAYVSNSVTTNNVFSLGNVFATGNVTTFGQAQVMSSNLYVSNTVTTGNVFVGNVISGNLFSSGNIVTLNAFTTTNIFASNVIVTGYVSAQNLVSTNVSVSNAITTTNVWTTNVISTGDLTFAGLFEKTTIDVTGNASVSNAITTTNVWTSNIYASGKVSFAGLPNLTTLYASNISVSNTILTTNVWTSNLVSTGDITIAGAVSAGITTLQVTGNTRVSHTVTSGNVYASGNIYVTADSQSVTGNIYMANALVTANLWATLSVNAGVGAYVDKTVILTDPTIGALAATVYTGAGQGTIVRTGHMPMHPALTTAPTGVWAGDTYFDNNFLYKYTTSNWRPIELLYPTLVPVIAAIGNQAGSSLGQRVVEVTQTATPFSSLGTVLWTISGAPTGTFIEGGSNSGCFIVIPATTSTNTVATTYTVTVGASNERGSAANQSFTLVMPVYVAPGGAALYTFTTATFTPGNAVGRTGPDIATARNGLTGTPTPSTWSGTYLNMTTTGIQLWTVPATGSYTITTQGARGGASGGGDGQGGYSARVVGTISLVQGQVLAIVCGQYGRRGSSGTYYNAGGGGGSFVYDNSTNTLYAAAGGGGGLSDTATNYYNNDPIRGQTGNNGGTGSNDYSNANGSAGGTNGARGGFSYSYSAGAGGGWNTAGNDSVNHSCNYSVGAITCGAGRPGGFIGGFGYSDCQGNLPGGFGGGGGGAGACCSSGSGGGGGYSGGGAGNTCCSSNGGGGGSYVSGMTSTSITTGYSDVNGYVTITKL